MKLFLIFCTLLSLLLPYSADAFVLVPRAMACMLYFRTDAVFTGQVLSAKEVHGMEDGEDSLLGMLYTLKVLRSYRGAKMPTIQVFTNNDSSRFPLKQGEKYLLFATQEGDKLVIGYDQVSSELKDAKVPLKDLDTIMTRKPGQGGDVFVRVVSGPFSDDTGGLAGVTVTIKGSAGSAESTSNAKGWLRVHVPAGTYAAVPMNPNYTFKSQDIGWQNSDSFTVPDGGCAEIQLEADPALPSTSN